MPQSVEIEFKSLLSETNYRSLITKYFDSNLIFFKQTNTYYDTPDFSLKLKQMGLRIRTYAQTAELTLKSPLENSLGLLETTDQLNLKLAQKLIAAEKILENGQVANFLKEQGIKLNELIVHGELTTKRIQCQLTPEILLVLDESWYHGHHDFELEMEVTEEAQGKAFFLSFLEENGILYTQAENKVARAFKAKLSN